LGIFIGGCASQKKARIETYQLGDRVELRPFTYNVIELQWKSQLGDLPKMRLPEHRFLLVRVSVTNGGGKEASVPLLSIEDPKGNIYQESASGESVENWFGMLRTISPAGTDQGWLLFDVPIGSYRLRLTNGGDPGEEEHSFVELPLRLDSDEASPPGD
jgi:hypothetical protein